MIFNSISSFLTWNIDVWNLFQTTSFSAYLRNQFQDVKTQTAESFHVNPPFFG